MAAADALLNEHGNEGNSQQDRLAASFYRDLSERLRRFADEVLEEQGVAYATLREETEQGRALIAFVQEKALQTLGYFLKPSQLFPREPTHATVETENALRQSEEKYRTLFNSIDEGVTTVELLFDDTGRAVDLFYLEQTPMSVQLTGLDLVGKWASKALSGGVEPHWMELLEKVAITGEPIRTEYQVKNMGWFSTYLSRVGEAGSKKVISVFADITERKRREASLAFLAEISEELLKLKHIEETNETIGKEIGRHFGVRWAMFSELVQDNEVAVAAYGWNDPQVPSLKGTYRLRDYLTDAQRAKSNAGEPTVCHDTQTDPAVDAQAYNALGIRSFINVPLARNGQWRFQHYIMHDEPRQWQPDEIALMQEITARIWARLEKVRVEEALAQSEEKYRTLFESMDEGFALVEVLPDEKNEVVDLVYLEANKAFERYSGMSDFVGKKVSDLFPALEPHWLDMLTTVYQTGGNHRMENSIAELNRWLDVHYSRIGGSGSRLIAVVFTDVTERKRREQHQEFLLKFSDSLRTLATKEAIETTALQSLVQFLGLDRSFIATVCQPENVAVIGPEYNRPGLSLKPLAGERHLSDFPASLWPTTEETLVVENISTNTTLSEQGRQSPGDLKLTAWVAVSARMEDHDVRWWLVASMVTPRRWNRDEILLIETVAERIWSAVEKAKVEEALRASEQRLQRMVNVPKVGVLTFDHNGKMLHANDAFLQMVGFSRDEFEAKQFRHEFTRPEHLEASQQTLVQLQKTGVGGPYEKEYSRKDGSKIWMMFVAADIGDGSLVEYAVDISDRKSTEEALRKSEEHLRLIIESAKGFAIFSMTPQGIINSWNTGAAEIFGWSEAEIMGQPGDVLFTPEDRDRGQLEAERQTAITHGVAPDVRWHECKDGGKVFIDGVVHPLYDNSGTLTGFVKIGRDLTAQHKAELALKESEDKYRTRLEKEVEQQTAELKETNTNLRYANENLQQFATIAAHDLQEPLRKIKLFTSVLQKNWLAKLPPDGQEVIQKIMLASDRMSQLISEVLQYSKISQGAKEFAPTDLHRIVQNLLSDLDLLLEEAGAAVDYSSPLPVIEANPLQLHQVFYNLLTNAVKFRKRSELLLVRISSAIASPDRVKAFPHLVPEKRYLEIIVADNGIGFEPEYAEQIFQIFERLHPVDEYEGTGVGLALCKKIAENHAGHIYAEAVEGKGATFHVLLPVKQKG